MMWSSALALPNEPSPSISVAVGITVGLLASLVQSLGLTIQRKSHVLNQAQPEELRKVDYRRPLWLLGFTIFLSSNILGSVFQIASLPVVILAPLGAVSLLWNAFFARLILGDVFSRYMIFGTLFVVVGAVLIGIFGIVPEPTHSLDDLLRLFGRTSFVVYFTLLAVAVIMILVATHITEWNYNRHNRISLPITEPSTPIATPDIPLSPRISATEATPLLNDAKQSRSSSPLPLTSRIPTLLAISYASMSGLLSGMCLIFAKSAVELLVLTAAGANQFGRWESWALVLGLIVFALLQLWYLHKSLTLEDPTLVCPLAFCFYNLSSILNGLIYFDQFDRLTNKQLGLVITGIVILLVGVGAVSSQNDTPDGEAEGGVTDGDWTVAEQVATSPPLSPRANFPHARRAATSYAGPASPTRPSLGGVLERHYDEDGTLLLSPGSATAAATNGHNGPSRRTVSSPSSFPSDDSMPLVLDQVSEEAHEWQDRLPHTNVQSPPLEPASGHGRTRTLSNTSAMSPPRRRTTRRGTLLSPGTGEGGAGDASAGTSAPLAGFSIGLSPISPGFSLIPRVRDSGTSEQTAGSDAAVEGADETETRRRGGRWSGLKNVLKGLTLRRPR